MNKEIFITLNKMAEKDTISYLLGKKEIKNLLDYIEDLQTQAEQGEHYKHLYSEIKKQKDDVVEGLKDLRQFVYNELVDFNVRGSTETYCKVKNLLRMLGETDD